MQWTLYANSPAPLEEDVLPWAVPGPLPVAAELADQLHLLVPTSQPGQGCPLLVVPESEMGTAQVWDFLARLAPGHYTDYATYANTRPWVPVAELMRLCGLRADYRNRADWAEVALFAGDVLEFGKEHDFAPAVLRLWSRLLPEHRNAWRELFLERSVRKNFIREIIQDFYDLDAAGREASLAEAIERSAQWTAPSRPFPGDRFRDLVRLRRYPRFEASRVALEEVRRSFPRVQGVALDVPAHLEDDALSLHLRFRSGAEFAAILDSLKDDRIVGTLEKMFPLL